MSMPLYEHVPDIGRIHLIWEKRIGTGPDSWTEGMYATADGRRFALLYLGERYSRYAHIGRDGRRRPGLWCRRINRGEALEWLENHCSPAEFCLAFQKLGRLGEETKHGRFAA